MIAAGIEKFTPHWNAPVLAGLVEGKLLNAVQSNVMLLRKI